MPDLPPPPSAPDPVGARAQAWLAARWAGLPSDARRRIALGVGGALAAMVVAMLVVWPAGGPPAEVDLPAAADPGAPAGREPVHVHGAGALVRPGLYRLPAGSRVADLIEAAGGPTAEADVHQLNLAARVSDGDRVYVPRIGEVTTGEAGAGQADGAGPGAGAVASQGGKLDLNTATQAQLEDLPGVGPATASAILDERKRRGRFKSVEELLDVRGIGPAKLDQIRDLVRV